jgi:methylmalonyl-CoA/ethylmalonyl-CoA epimerase
MAPANDFGLSFDHFGLATRDSGKAVAFLRGLGYQAGPTVFDPLQNVNLILCVSTNMPAVEVIFPAETAGPLDVILKDRNEAFYHLCYRSPDLAASLAGMRNAGHRVLQVAPPKPAILFDHRPVSFYFVKTFGLIEIVENGIER